MATLIDEKLIEVLRGRFRLDWKGIHGASHWSRVRQSGLLPAERIGPAVNVRVVELFAFLHDSCRHDDGLQEAEVTVQVCWDADRLDLGRVGHVPDPGRLCTPAARDKKLIEWAYKRSTRGWR